MNFSKWILKLKKRGIITEKPNPIIPFILWIIILGLAVYGRKLGNKSFDSFMCFFAIFAFLFAVGHYIVFRIIKKNKKR